MIYEFFVLLIAAYLAGSIPLAFIIAKKYRGIDLRYFGSGNVGFSNVSAATSKWLALPVLFFDLGKGMLFAAIARWLGFPVYLQVLVGLGAVIGHAWPVFLGFNAGRGVLTSIGVLVAIEPRLIGLLVLLALLFIPFKMISLGTMISIVLLPFLSWFSAYPPLDWLITQPINTERLPVTVSLAAISVVTLTRRVTVPKTDISYTVKPRELVLNRLFLDRDIRDRDTWIHRTLTKSSDGKGNS